MEATKVCAMCKAEKPLSAFAVRKTHRPGKPVSQCMSCKQEYNSMRRKLFNAVVRTIERKSKLKAAFGLSMEQYSAMLAAQGGGCAICGVKTPSKRTTYFAVDHCHATGKIRGLLCTSCNRGLGNFRDSQTLLDSAVQYLNRS